MHSAIVVTKAAIVGYIMLGDTDSENLEFGCRKEHIRPRSQNSKASWKNRNDLVKIENQNFY